MYTKLYRKPLLIVVMCVVACGPRGRESEEPVAQTKSASESSSQSGAALAPYEQIGPIEDASTGSTRRVSVRITIKPGLPEEEIRRTLGLIAEDLAHRESAKAAMVLAYRPGDDTGGVYTVGRAVFAPNGRWEEAEGSAPMHSTVDLGSLYFEPEESSGIKEGDRVTLKPSLLDRVTVSSESDKWGDEYVVAKLPAGTKAVVMERKTYALTADHEMVRYRVRFSHAGKQLDGWISEADVEGTWN